MNSKSLLLSIVVPCYNEADNIVPFYKDLKKVLEELSSALEFKPALDYEILYVNDGSTDDTYQKLLELSADDDRSANSRVKVLSLSRNFGKEIATTAGIQHAKGDAILTIDADGQHPPQLIPQFLKSWQAGNQVVIGVRSGQQAESFTKHYGSKLFYKLFNRLSGETIVPGSTDFRLIDKVVQQEFIKLTEHGRMTRGLIDWLGFKRDFIPFEANTRLSGKSTYDHKKLFSLAVNSFISVSLFPLYLSLYLGLIIVPLSAVVGLFSALEMLVGDPLGLRIHGTAFVAILILFAVGILLISQGFIALYLSRVHTETQNRPLYVVDKSRSLDI